MGSVASWGWPGFECGEGAWGQVIGERDAAGETPTTAGELPAEAVLTAGHVSPRTMREAHPLSLVGGPQLHPSPS